MTVELMAILGHAVKETLDDRTSLAELLQDAARVLFFQQQEVATLDLDHFEETPEFETIPHPRR